MPQDWMPGAERVPGAQAGLTMNGGPAKVTHHITTGGDFDFLTGYLVRLGYEPTLIVDPVSGRIAQFLSAANGGYALEDRTVPTNAQGSRHIQIEWCWVSMTDLTIDSAPKWHEVWGRVLDFCRANGVADAIPFGKINALTDRDPAKWVQGGHACHLNAPGNSHVDGLPVSSAASLFANPPSPPAPAPAAHKEIDMFTASDFGGTLWVIDGMTRKRISNPAVAHTLNAAGVPSVGVVASDVLGAFPVAVDADAVVNAARDVVVAAITTAQAAGGTPDQIAAATVAELAQHLGT